MVKLTKKEIKIIESALFRVWCMLDDSIPVGTLWGQTKDEDFQVMATIDKLRKKLKVAL